MKVICEKDKALEGVRIAQNAITSATLPILSHLLLSAKQKRVEVTATNLETTICSFFEATVEEEGSICLPGEKLYSILRELPPGKFSFETDNTKSFIRMDKISFTLVGISSEEFPEVPPEAKTIFSMPQSTFQEILVKTMFSAGQDEVRQNLNCVLLEALFEKEEKPSLRAVTTDGRRLSWITVPYPSISEPFKILIPLKAARELTKILSSEGDIEIGLEENRAFFKTSRFSFFSQLMEAKFPDYRGVIPKDYKVRFEVERDNFIAAIKRVSLLSEQQSRLVRFHLEEDLLDITAASAGVGTALEKLPVKTEGEIRKIEISFNAAFLLEALRVMEGDVIEIRLIDQESPGVFYPKTHRNYMHILMPVKLREE
ncbi:DNA polymerase III subunit beta [Candidatus Aerophobetes bacterium]|uniref:Beta sliding clamp n=1 Tax=Aerophobetes bacterium TaxID=2030807 RepID=A0A662DGT2_UNCAE|nr:MAG: DNA polymerase III subunit beta [Candidatus Aerophobetes bacterium]